MADQKMIRGYQWGADGSYIGVYDFPDNQDKEAVHLPPHTTLLQPPQNVPVGFEAAWDGAQGSWVVREEDLSWMDADSRSRMQDYLARQAEGIAGPHKVASAGASSDASAGGAA